MAEYRLYRMDRYSGHILAVEQIHAPDDVGAISAVRDLAGEDPLELWQGGHKVRRFDARAAAAPPPSPGTDARRAAEPGHAE